MCVWARWAGFCNVFRLLGLCDFPFQKKNKGNAGCWLHSHCCLFPHQFWTGSKICSSGSSATSRLYCWYFVTLARLLLLPCYYPYKKQTILYIAADNFLDHDLILFRIYIYIALAVGFLRVMMGYFQVGTNASGMAQPCPCLPIPGFLAQRTNLRDNFLSAEVSRTVRNGSADLQNGSERFCRPQLCTEIFLHSFQTPPKNGQEQFLLFRIFKTFQRAALWLQGPRLQEKGVRKTTKGRQLLRLSLWTGSAKACWAQGRRWNWM